MVSCDANFHLIGTTPHRHEEEGLEMLRAALPSYPPFASWSLFTFFTDHGHPYEVDALVLTPKCLFLVEMKAWKGKVVGGSANYLTTFSKERGRESPEHPFALADRKAKAFMSKARRVSRNFDKRVQDQIHNLRFEALVWLTHAEGIDLSASSAARGHVVHCEAGLNEALQGRFPGAFTGLQNNSYNKETLRALTKVIAHEDFGLESRTKPLTVDGGRFTLGKIIEAGDGYQDRWTEENPKTPRRRVRSYIVNRSRERNDANVEKRAQKEAELLRGLEHPDILGLDTFDPDGPIGPAFVFRAFEGKSLTAFMEESKDASGEPTLLDDDDRLAILDRIASALEYCHRNEIVHGALSPDAVLVRRLDDRTRSRDGKTDIEVKLTRFALATTEDGESSLSTRLLTQLGGSTASVFEAPEVRMGAKPSMASDIFSLGAIAYFLFSGKYPASSSAELTRKLIDNDGLFLSEVASELAHKIPALELAVLAATYREQLQRKETVPTPLAFLRLVEDALTSGEKKVGAAEKKIDPLDARKETRLVDDNDAKKVLIVLEKVGSGSTADVFKVKKEGEEQLYALKVPSADEHNERLEAESKTLELLGNKPGMSGLVRLVDTRTIGGRHCLLLEFAGDTLRDELREQGVLSLDFGRRWGQDLIAALRTLEECGVQHRDIKPSNIGVTSGVQKQKKHLLLFDFSLSSSDATQLNIGTRPYHDPELANRKRWDDAADRWAASITLYEMFTGSRPKFIDSAKGDALACTVEAERIDADVRHGLVEFFERAFCFNAKKRFSTADGMLEAFNKALYKVSDLPADVVQKKRKKLTGLDGNSSVSELDLSVREANALDRMGIYTLDELASLRSNTLSVVRGVGRQTAANIVKFIGEVREHLKTPDAQPTDVFLPGWHGLNDAVYSSILSKALSKELGNRFIAAGLQSSLDVALAPRQQVKNLADKARRAGAAEKLSDIEHWLEELARITASDTPSTLKTAVDVVIPPSTKGQKRGNKARERMRQFFGIDDVEGFDRHGKASDLARVAGVTRAAISLELVSTRNAWTDNDDTSALVDIIGDRVMGFLQSNGGVARIELVANDLMEEFTPDASLSATEQNRYAEALVRVAVEAGGGSRASGDAQLLLQRMKGGPLVALDKEALQLACALGKAADVLVDKDIVLPEEAAVERLQVELKAQLSTDASRPAGGALPYDDGELLSLAAVAAEKARLSARRELYPKGLPAKKAVLLSAVLIQANSTPDAIRKIVQRRYPEAKPLPKTSAALGKLLEPLRLAWRSDQKKFVEKDATQHTSVQTELHQPVTVTSTSKLSLVQKQRKKEQPAPGEHFMEQLHQAKKLSGFRVVLWRGVQSRRMPDAFDAARTLAHFVGGDVVNLSDVLLGHAADVARELGMPNLIPAFKADAAGPADKHWSRVKSLMVDAGERVRKDFSPYVPDEVPSDMSNKGLDDASTKTLAPRVFVDPGLLARYDLLDVVGQWVNDAREVAPDGMRRVPCYLVLSAIAGEGPVIDVGSDVADFLDVLQGSSLVAMPGLQSHEVLDMPADWFSKHHPQVSANTGKGARA